MSYKKTITILVPLIAVFAFVATITGIYSNDGTGQYKYTSIRGKTVSIYGKGLYRDMSAELAPQGIAQDYVTLFIAVPLLCISFLMARKGSRKGRYLLAGALGYFLVTYLFYTVMAMYNALFLVYILLMGASSYAFILSLLSFNISNLQQYFKSATPTKTTGAILISNSIAISSLWLSIIVPPLLNDTLIPIQVEHYTTLIVHGLDLGILLPAAFICGVLWIRKTSLGYLLGPVYFIFLSVLMCALTAKVMAMSILGYNVVPVIFIIPVFNLIAIFSTIVILKNVVEISPAVNHEKAIPAE